MLRRFAYWLWFTMGAVFRMVVKIAVAVLIAAAFAEAVMRVAKMSP